MDKTVTFREHPASVVVSPTLRQSFNELVICGICKNILDTPKMLSCQHTFCLACLTADRKGRPSSSPDYQCQTCQVIAPVIDFNDLPKNLHIDTLLLILDPRNGEQLSERPVSIMVDSSSINNRCSKCDVLLAAATTSTGSAETTTTTPEDGVDGKLQKSIKCSHCKLSLCPVCFSAHMDQLRDQLQGLDAQLIVVRQRLQKKSEQFESRFAELEDNISIFINRKIEKLKVKEKRVIDEANQMLQPERERFKEIRLRIKNLSKSIQEDNGNNTDLDKIYLEKHKEMAKIINYISRWGETQIKFDEATGSIELDNSGNGRGSESEAISPELEMKKRLFKVKLMWNRCPHPMGIAEAPWKDDLVDDQLIYIAGSDSKMVIGIDRRKGRVVRKIQRSAMEYPHSIAFSADREELIVSDKWANFIFAFNKEGILIRVFGDKGEDMGFLRSPEGIAIDGDELYVCDTGNDRVQCFDLITGDVLFQFGNLRREQISGKAEGRSKRVDLNAPTSIAIHGDKIFVLDSAESRIKVFGKPTMNQVGEFGKLGKEKGQFDHPEGIAVDANGFIYVGDSGNARIQVFNRKLEFVRTIGSRGQASGQFNWISGLCLTSENELIVSDFKNHLVQIMQ